MGKDTAIYLRIEEEKKLALEKKAQDAGLSLSTYLVEQGLHGKVVDFSELRKIYPQLMRIGNNINQLARKANAGFASRDEVTRALRMLDRVYELMYQLSQQSWQ